MFVDKLEEKLNISKTENGALGYKTTGSALVDFNFKIASYRDNLNKLYIDFKKVWNEDNEIALKYLFYVRDIRGGLGERDIFRECIKHIIDNLDERVFDWIAQYGRYDDLFVFFDTKLESKMLQYVHDTLVDDTIKMRDNKGISLLAKWMPSINASSNDTKQLAKRFIKAFNFSNIRYRKMLSSLRKYIDIVERKCCTQDWSNINYKAVPSKANLKYSKSFIKHDKIRREEYLDKLLDGKTTINSSTCFPHDIVYKYRSDNRRMFTYGCKSYDKTLEAMWNALPNFVENNNILFVRDGSGSMTNQVSIKSNVTALDVSTSLAIYFSERSHRQFKDKFITFSSKPEYVDLSKLDSLHDKLVECYNYDDCTNTNIEATFDLVLSVAKENNLNQSDIPDILIVSDMEFDSAVYCDQNKLFDTIRAKFNKEGYDLPKLIFWNVASRTNTIPLTSNTNGVILVSGFSAAIVKMILSNELDPYKAIIKILEKYSNITLNK